MITTLAFSIIRLIICVSFILTQLQLMSLWYLWWRMDPCRRR